MSSALQVTEQRTSAPLVPAGAQRELRKKRCTDFPCCLVFLICLALLAVLASLGIQHGNTEVLDRFVSGRDLKGRVCGKDPGVEHFKLAYFTLPEGHAPVEDAAWTNEERSQLSVVCTSMCPRGVAGDTGKPVRAREMGLCAEDMYNHSSANRSDPGNCTWYGGNTTRFANYCIDLQVFSVGTEWGQSVQDIRSSWAVLVASPAIAMALGFVFLSFIHRCGAPCIWVALLVGGLAVPIGAGVWVYEQALSGKGAGAAGLSRLSPADQKLVAYALWALAGATVVLLCCFASAINSVVAVMRATSQFLKDVPSQMLQPILVGFAQFAIFVAWLGVFVAVSSIGLEEGEDEKECLAIGDVYCLHWTSHAQIYGLIFLGFMLYWILNFLHALSHFGTSYAMSVWYFTRVDVETGRKRPSEGGHTFCDCRLTLHGVCRGLVSHPGSLAFGAFTISAARIGRLLLWWASKDDESRPQNAVAKCVRRCVNCLADCFARFIEFVSEHAYVEIALQGQGFCASAQQATALAVMKPSVFALVGRVAATVRFLGVFTVVAGTTNTAGLILAIWPPAGLHSFLVPLIASAVIAFVVGEVMLHPFSAAARASLHCFCLDEERTRALGLTAPEHTPEPLLRLVQDQRS